MKKSKFIEEQIGSAARQVEGGTPRWTSAASGCAEGDSLEASNA